VKSIQNCGTYERGRGSFGVSAAEVKEADEACRINAWSYRVDMAGIVVAGCKGSLME